MTRRLAMYSAARRTVAVVGVVVGVFDAFAP